MLFDEIDFHDAMILEVREIDQAIDFILDFPTEWETNTFKKRILRFKDVAVYLRKEIPLEHNVTILDIKQLFNNKHTWKTPGGVATSAHRVELITNAGSRFIEFDTCELLPATN